MNSFTITTTNNIEGWNITNYYTPISANIVIGSNIFSDISASFTDFFGGRSDSYEQKLKEMYDSTLRRLRKQAESMGANSIVGLKIDFGEISGKGNQMFMLTAVGTPVIAVRNEINNASLNTNHQAINGELVETKIRAKKLIQDFADGTLSYSSLTDQRIEFILKSRLLEFSGLVVDIIKKGMGLTTINRGDTVEKISQYFKTIDKREAKKVLYDVLSTEDLGRARIQFINIIKNSDLIDYNHISDLLKSPGKMVKKSALKLISLPKESYLNTDIALLREFTDAISNRFPNTSESVISKGLLSSSKEAWLCMCGKTNDMNIIYCSKCKEDKFGFTEEEVSPSIALKIIENRLAVIEGIGETRHTQATSYDF